MTALTYLYRHFDADGVLLYVGIAGDHTRRLSEHRRGSRWFQEIASVRIEKFPSREEALAAERIAVASEKPKYNVKLVSCLPTKADRSRAALLDDVLDVESKEDSPALKFNIIYAPEDIARCLGVRIGVVQKLLESGQMGCFYLQPARPGTKPRRRITGWQFIDYLESVGGLGK